MKSFSNELPNADKTVTPEQLETTVKTEVEKLRADVKKSHFWLAISIAASMVFTVAVVVVAFFIHH